MWDQIEIDLYNNYFGICANKGQEDLPQVRLVKQGNRQRDNCRCKVAFDEGMVWLSVDNDPIHNGRNRGQ
jgi:hypothetical protein